jgi:hypothetical protein
VRSNLGAVACTPVLSDSYRHSTATAYLNIPLTEIVPSQNVKGFLHGTVLFTCVNKDLGYKEFEASNGWLEAFEDVFLTLFQDFDALRGCGMNIRIVTEYFNLLQYARVRAQNLSDGVCLSPNRIFNMDETGFDRNMSNDWGLALAGLRTPRKLSAVTSFHITMVNCIAANRMPCAPFFIMPAKRRPRDSERSKVQDLRQILVSWSQAF